MTRRTHAPRAFTLLELLLVVFILAAVAATSMSLVDRQDQQLRYDVTKARMETIRSAVVGPEGAAARGAAGFVADVGRFPSDATELLSLPAGMASFTFDVNGPEPTHVACGWNGPYVPIPAHRAGTLPRLLDGAGRPFEVAVAGGSLSIQSTAGDEADAHPAPLVVTQGEAFVQVVGLAVEVTFDAPLGPGETVRIALRYPVNGAPTGAIVADLQPVNGGVAAVGTFTDTTWIPWGVRSLEVVEGSDPLIRFGSGTPKRVLLRPRFTPDPEPIKLAWSVVP